MALTGAASWETHEYKGHDEEYERALSPTTIDPYIVEEPPEPRTLKELLIDYANRTTLHGYGYIVQPTPFVLRRVLWSIYIMLTTAYFLAYASQQLMLFLEFQKNSLVEVQYRRNVSFPSITICNQNPFRLSAMIENGWYETAKALSAKTNQTIKCGEGTYHCTEDDVCINADVVCDRFPDCDEASEENNCDDVCSLIYLKGDGTNSTPAFDRRYLRHNTGLLTGGVLYVSYEEPYIYLLQREGEWILTNKHDQGFIYAKVESDDVSPVSIGTKQWLVNISGNWLPKQASISCALSFADLLSFPKGEVKGSIDILEMYENASHRIEDMLTSCIWKGKYPCQEVGNVTAVLTRMGKCFTIEFNEPVIENPGPEYGLSLTLNIQQYEYIEGTSQGLGVKVLLHEPVESPRVRELGLALSPGIVSQLVLESTKVKNLKPPWGECVELKLKYFDEYDKSKCITECETDYLEKKCGCRVFYMPEIDGYPPSCDVDTYLTCARPELDAFRESEEHCPHCGDRCIKMNYIASSSFALMGAELGDAQNLRTYSLGRELQYAREIAYRHLKAHYQRTMKVVYEMTSQISQFVKYLDVLGTQSDIDHQAITNVGLLVERDSSWAKDVLKRARRQLSSNTTQTLIDARLKFLGIDVKTFSAIDDLLDRYINLIDDFRAEHNLGKDELILDFRGCSADCRHTAEGLGYVGMRTYTVSGRQCQRWDEQTPHTHNYTKIEDERFPEADIREASNFCRNPDRKPSGPWCYTTDPDVEWETCQIPICSDCLEQGQVYRGNRRLTLSGRTCQRWDSQSPHQHNFQDADFPEKSLSEASNFCRNPDNKPTGPWCYTTDPDKSWETCALPLCHECKRKNLGTDYLGTKAVTVSGIPCQRWDMQYPHKHGITDVSRFPDRTLEDASNFCRNPDHKPSGPWCFTTDPKKKWEACDIPLCTGCRDARDEDGSEYVGTESFTVFGRACQRWDSQVPHQHGFTKESYFPDKTLADASNYCRNPDPTTHSVPWCYTMDPDFEWEPCDIPLCQDCLISSLGKDYRGNRAMTYTNTPCQRWDSQYPHRHNYDNSGYFPEKQISEVHNYCRNPDNSPIGPWCYTTDPKVEREYCGLQVCPECRIDERGKTYTGIKRQTKSGRRCQAWTSQQPHPHPNYDVSVFPDSSLIEASDYCRNPDDKVGVGPWCYTTDPNVEWESCEVPMCASSDGDCVFTDTGRDYVGTRSITVSGKVCQGWYMQYPHKHNYTDPSMFPDENLVEAKNYCRNPSGITGVGPWCLTMDPDTRMESCGLSKCLDCRTKDTEYTGKRFVTVSGLVCQQWNRQWPHAHPYTSWYLFPEKDVDEAKNYCRNPDKRQSGPWCYTTSGDVVEETCGIEICAGAECRTTDIGESYMGTRVTTQSGLSCQRWDMQIPHQHPYTDDSMFPDPTITDAANFCRNPSKDPALGPWCYTTDPAVRLETCAIAKCSECMPDALGRKYIGKQTVSSSGRSCQRWSSQAPHTHDFVNDDDFPDGSVEAAENYCRNPDGKTGGPWCFTMDFQVRWEYCGVYSCKECRTSYYGDDYRGTRLTTSSGKLCQRWDSQYPHKHNFTSKDFPDPSISDASNYCRNPDKKPGTGPWCFTTDRNVVWESCGVPFCNERAIRPDNEFRQYTGRQAITASGLSCQYWSSQKHHAHNFTDPDQFPDPSLLSVVNFCRNPDGKSSGPWCFTMDPDIEWETCGVPLSTDCRLTTLGREYTGQYRITVSGRACQRWDSQTPHVHAMNDTQKFPDATLEDAANYCRNPDGSSSGPWCYTTDIDVRWETCAVPMCSECKPTHLGTTYKGTRSRTVSGHICHYWNMTLPYRHKFTAKDFPDATLADASNYCRNPNRDPNGPWCYVIDPTVVKETCGLPLCIRAGRLDTEQGVNYRGRDIFTKSGRLCQRWDRQYPHNHSFTDPSMFPDSSLEEAANFCRNPNGDADGPWCYTMDADVERESCGIPRSIDCIRGNTYVGRQLKTRSGVMCQRWTTDSPHYSQYSRDSDFPDASAREASNYCRNPSGYSGPWCYTMDKYVTLDMCDVPSCSDCRMTYLGYDYRGTRSTTVSGRPCQRWDSQIPHRHNMTNPIRFPDETLEEAANYCRNPDRRPGTGPWCYTDDPLVEWEFCPVPICEDCKLSDTGEDYVGYMNVALNNTPCKEWRLVTSVSYRSSDFLQNSVYRVENYCRQPSNNQQTGTGPWCHSAIDETIVSCGIPRCKDCRRTQYGQEYVGRRSTTVQGQECQRWDRDSPNSVWLSDAIYYPDRSVKDAENYCRNPARRADGPYCYLARSSGIETCALPYCFGRDCYWHSDGQDYRGYYAYTVSGRSCMSWKQYIDSHPDSQLFNSSSFPEKSYEEAYNYCRNPGGIRQWLWCYTTDPLVEWEYCPITLCQDCLDPAETYRGRKSFTISGRPCQRWDRQTPHRHNYTDDDFPDVDISEASNYCRTPDNDTVPWCFTLDPNVRKEECDIRRCDDCYMRSIGAGYTGPTDVTISGRKCQAWKLSAPHSHPYIYSEFPDGSSSQAESYCRLPEPESTNKARPWCYTIDPKVVWEYCPVETCASAVTGPDCVRDYSYNGMINTDQFGTKCSNWTSHKPVIPIVDHVDGSVRQGVVYLSDGTTFTGRGVVQNGSCLELLASTSVNDSSIACTYDIDADADADAGHCTVERSPQGRTLYERCLNDNSTEPVTNCTLVDVHTCQTVDDCLTTLSCSETNLTICCAFGCCKPTNSCLELTLCQCNVAGADVCTAMNANELCCENATASANASSVCCQSRACRRTDASAYRVRNMTGYSIDGPTAGIAPDVQLHDPDGRPAVIDLVDCRLELLAEGAHFPEPLVHERPVDSANFCRNPRQSEADAGTWCYRSDGTRLSCDIPFCVDNPVSVSDWPHIPQAEVLNVETIPAGEERTTSVPVTNTSTNSSDFIDHTDTVTAAYNVSDSNDESVTEAPQASDDSDDNYVAKKSYQPRCDYYLDRAIRRYNQTLFKLVTNLMLSLRSVPSYESKTVDVPEFSLNRTLLEPIEANVPIRCRWCLDSSSSGSSIISMTKALIEEWHESVIGNASKEMLAEVESALRDYLATGWLHDRSAPIESESVAELRTRLGAVRRRVRRSGRQTQDVLGRLSEVRHLIDDLLEYSWLLQTSKELTKLVDEYAKYWTSLGKQLASYRPRLADVGVQFRRLLASYRDGELSLQRLAGSFDFLEIETDLLETKINFVRLLDVGHIKLQNVESQINQIYYVLMAYIRPDDLRAQSLYWSLLGIERPPVDIPDLGLVSGQLLPVTKFGIAPNESTNAFWREKTANIRVLIGQLEQQVTELSAAILEAKNYFRDYVKGNQIDLEFFRNNFLRVDLFYQDLSDRKVVETKVYEYSNLLSDVGGLMGLLMGASVLTVGELLDLFIYNCLKKCQRDKEERQNKKMALNK